MCFICILTYVSVVNCLQAPSSSSPLLVVSLVKAINWWFKILKLLVRHKFMVFRPWTTIWRESLAYLANRLQFTKLKSSKVVVSMNNPLADLFICHAYFHQALEKSKFAKHCPRQTFKFLWKKFSQCLIFKALKQCHYVKLV